MNKRQRKKQQKKMSKNRLFKSDDLVWECQQGYEDAILATGVAQLVCDVVASISQNHPADWDQIKSVLDGFFFTPDLLVRCRETGHTIFVKPGEFVRIGQKLFVSSDGKSVDGDGYAVGEFVPALRRIRISATAIFGCQFLKCPCTFSDSRPCIEAMTPSRTCDLIAHELGHAFDPECSRADLSGSMLDIDIASEKRASSKSRQWGFQSWLGSIKLGSPKTSAT